MKRLTCVWALPLILCLAGFVGKGEEKSEIDWVSIEEAAQLAEQDGKKILVDLYTDWCGWCKKMDRDTYSKREVINYINDNYHAVKFDAEQRRNISIGNRDYKYLASGRRGVHELALRLTNGRPSYPTMAILGADFARLTSVPGYKKSKELLPILAYFAEDAYQTQSWNSFMSGYGSGK